MAKQRDLSNAPALLRGPLSKGLAAGADVDRIGGDNGAGLIRGAAVITRGEALGHGLWIDNHMLQQTHDAINAEPETGSKARFTHPGLSSDGMGKFLGRFKNATLDGDVVRADLHFSKAAHETPDGNLADYVMELADEDPAAFGNSISFMRDTDAERQFRDSNQQVVEVVDEEGTQSQRKVFRSPDELNTKNLRHARLASLRAVDTVDSPAANPGGMFHATDVAHEAEALVSYACGLTDEKPAVSHFDVNPDRVSGFVTRFLDRHDLEIKPKEKAVGVTQETTNETGGSEVDHAADFADRYKLFVECFGEANGSKWLAAGKTHEQAVELHAAEVEAARVAELGAKDEAIASLTSQVEELQQRVEQAQTGSGEAEGVEFNADGEQPTIPARFNNLPDGVARYAAGLKLSGK